MLKIKAFLKPIQNRKASISDTFDLYKSEVRESGKVLSLRCEASLGPAGVIYARGRGFDSWRGVFMGIPRRCIGWQLDTLWLFICVIVANIGLSSVCSKNSIMASGLTIVLCNYVKTWLKQLLVPSNSCMSCWTFPLFIHFISGRPRFTICKR